MKVLKILALVLVFVVLVVAGLGLQVMQGVERSVLRPQFYFDIFKEYDLLALPLKALGQAFAGAPEEGMPEQVRQVLEKGIAQALSPAWVEEQVRLVVTGSLDFVKGVREDLDLVIDLKEPKNVFADAVAAELKGLPPAEQLRVVPPEVIQSLSQRISRQELAKTGVPLEVFRDLAQEFLEEANIPDRVDLAAQMKLSAEAQQNLARARLIRKYALVVPWVALLALGGVCLLLAGPGGGLKWVGSSMAAGGALVLAGLWTGGRYIDEALAKGTKVPEQMAAALGADVLGIAVGVKEKIFALVRGVSLAYTAVGIALIVAGVLVSRRPRARKDRV